MGNTTQTVGDAASSAISTATEALSTATEHATEQSGGMPQLDTSTFAHQVFWLIVALIVTYLVLSKIALPRIAGILADRQSRMGADIAAAERLKAEAVAAEAAYAQALADARAEAGRIVAAARADIQADLDKATAKADAEIAARTAESGKRIDEIRQGAVAAVGEVARSTAEAVVGKLGGSADAKTVAAAVAARMKGGQA